jgi:hypothetical protein
MGIMRNTIQYPVTKEELIASLDKALVEYRKELHLGDITGVALSSLRRALESSTGATWNELFKNDVHVKKVTNDKFEVLEEEAS